MAHVLVLSPDSSTTTLLEYALKAKHTVSTAATGVVALGLVESGDRFDVIFAEVRLLDMPATELRTIIGRSDPDQARRVFIFPPDSIPSAAEVYEIIDGFLPIRRIPSRSNMRLITNEEVVVSRKDPRRER
jgi:DNA-binding NtrC family response regulator